MEFHISHQDELVQVVEYVLKHHKDQRVIFLEGNLGAGKTRFVEAFVKKIGYQESIISPTFSIVNEYSFNDSIVYHMDLYRLDRVEDLFEIGMEDYLFSGHYCFIEWPQLLEDVFDLDPLRIKIDIISFSERKILI